MERKKLQKEEEVSVHLVRSLLSSTYRIYLLVVLLVLPPGLSWTLVKQQPVVLEK